MLYLAQSVLPNEITGIGTVEFDHKTNTYRVTEIFVPKQTASTALCQFRPTALHEIISELAENEVDEIEKLYFRWHSHGNYNVFFSSTDEADIETWQGDRVINLVINAREDRIARFDTFYRESTKLPRLRDYPVNVFIDLPENPELKDACQRIAKEKVTIARPKIPGKKGAKKDGGLF